MDEINVQKVQAETGFKLNLIWWPTQNYLTKIVHIPQMRLEFGVTVEGGRANRNSLWSLASLISHLLAL